MSAQIIGWQTLTVWAGVLLFALNFISDRLLNVPLGEIVLMGYLLLLIWQERSVISSSITLKYIVILLILFIFIFLITMHNNMGFGELVRTEVKYLFIFAPVMAAMLLRRPQLIVGVLIGFLLAHEAYCLSQVILGMVTEGTIPRPIRHLVPAPLVLLLVGYAYRHFLTPSLSKILIGLGLVNIPICLVIEARGPLFSLVLGLGLGAVTWLIRPWVWPAWLVYTVLPLVPVVILLTWPVTDFIYQQAFTFSNVERIHLLDVALQIIQDNPWTGIGFDAFAGRFADVFEVLTGWQIQASGPHNFYLETATALGLPMMLICIGLLAWLYGLALYRSPLGPVMACWGGAVVAVYCMVYGYTGVRRFEMLLIWVVLLAGVAVGQRYRTLPAASK